MLDAKYWKKISPENQNRIISDALDKNVSYAQAESLGVPASTLDNQVFYNHASFLKEAPFLRTIVSNPNHIGCHTLGESEVYFEGTQQIEREVIHILSEDLLHAEKDSCDGYIAAGGTEANIQAIWIYRNYFMQEFDASLDEILIVCSSDTHYSVAKAANLLQLDWKMIDVDFHNRKIVDSDLDQKLNTAKAAGKKYIIAIANMATTMFGSVDDADLYANAFKRYQLEGKIHVDAAFGGFIYPVSHSENKLDFSNPNINSITLDAHKMLQAPYGTGVFLIRKGWMKYTFTKEAQYVNGQDITLCGSRSGGNAVAVWMILQTYGPFGWFEKINNLLYRTQWLCEALDALNIAYFREEDMNIVTIEADQISETLADRYGLVPDSHGDFETKWYKIVLMEHVDLEILSHFITEFKAELQKK